MKIERKITQILLPLLFLSVGLFGQCSITNVFAEAHPCTDEGSFLIDLEFDHTGTTNTFNVIINTINYGTFVYGETFYTVGPVTGTEDGTHVIGIVDSNFETCWGTYTLENIDCFPNNECGITDLVVEVGNCNTDGTYPIAIDFEVLNPIAEFFSVYHQDELLGVYGLNDVPLTDISIPVDNNLYHEIQIVVGEDSECIATTNYQALCLIEACNVSGLSITPGVCSADGVYPITIDFDYVNTSNEFFDVFQNNELIGYYELADLPVTIPGIFSNDLESQNFRVCINDAPDCCREVNLPSPCSLEDCEINNVFVEYGPCDAAGQVMVYLFFQHQATDGSFQIYGNGNNYGTFDYGNDSYTIGPIGANPDVIYDFVVVDLANEACSGFTQLQGVSCNNNNNCFLSEILVTTGECNPGGVFPITINFEYESPTSDLFEVFTQGNSLGSFSLIELPLTIPNFNGTGNPNSVEEITVCINDDPDCCQSVAFDSPCNNNDNCEISDVVVEYGLCDAAGNVMVYIFFQSQNMGGGFQIVGNGNNYGTFDYNEINSYTIGPIAANPDIEYEFIVQDLENDGCSAFTVLEGVSCNNNNNCFLSEILVTTGECNGIGTYPITINFEYQSPINTSFDVMYQGDLIGTYLLSELPVTLPNFMTTDEPNTPQSIIVCMNDDLDCCQDAVFFSPCFNSGDCQIDNVNAELYCDENGQIFAALSFDTQNTGSTFQIVGNGNNYGSFDYNATNSYTFGPISTHPDMVYEFAILDLENENCSAFTAIEGFDCNNNNECFLSEILVTPGECSPDGVYSITINFEHSNSGNEFFEVYYQGDTGIYLLNDLPITIPNVIGTGFPNALETILVCINDDPGCCQDAIYEAPNCNPNNCSINNLVGELYCDSDGQVFAELSFESQNTSDEFFIFHLDQGFGPYEYGNDSYTVGPLSSNLDSYTFTVVDNQNANCAKSITLVASDIFCGCSIYSVDLQYMTCDDDGNFMVAFYVDYASNSGSFEVTGNGQNYGIFDYSSALYIIGPVQANDTENYEFIVTDIDDPNCSNYTELLNWACGPPYVDPIVTITPGDCGGPAGGYSITIDIDYDFSTSGTGTFTLYDGDIILGVYDASELPLTLAGFGMPDDPLVTLTVCIDGNPFCCADASYEAPNCNPNDCSITNLGYEVHPCDDQGNVLIDFFFTSQNTGDSFQVTGNGVDYGTFAFGEDFYTVGPVDAGPNSIYQFTFSDVSNPNCSAFILVADLGCDDEPTDCEITNLEFYPLTCNPDGESHSGLVIVDAPYQNATTFNVYNNADILIGNYPYGNEPILIEAFPSSEDPISTITICDTEQANCCKTLEFISLDCQSCFIGDVFVNTEACDEESNFNVQLNFEHTGTGGLGFLVLGNGENYGVFDYADLPISVGPFDGSSDYIYELVVVDLAVQNCLQTVAFEGPACPEGPEKIWPGDVNLDNISNHFDLLNIGVAFGSTGPLRNDDVIDWSGWLGDDWSSQFLDETNFKHADCNGDGIVNEADQTAITVNYNLTHGEVSPIEAQVGDENDPPFFVDLPEASDMQPGMSFSAPIILGSSDLPVEEMYGIAFTIVYDPMMQGVPSIEIGNSWLGTSQDLLKIDKKYIEAGKIEVAVTRIDQQNVGGSGPILHYIGIIDDILGKQDMSVEIINVKAIRANETFVQINIITEIVEFPTTVQNPVLLDQWNIFPNPSASYINVEYSGSETPKSIQIYNVVGQQVLELKQPSNFEKIQVSDWAPGIYLVKMIIDNQSVTKKIKVTR